MKTFKYYVEKGIYNKEVKDYVNVHILKETVNKEEAIKFMNETNIDFNECLSLVETTLNNKGLTCDERYILEKKYILAIVTPEN
jgi:arsenate reductase-like glutaredoxin family protein